MGTKHNHTVLTVDDDEINLMILIKTIQDAGYGVKSFTSGEAAWEYVRDYPNEVDIALLDKMMPGINGIELMNRIRSKPSLKHMPVIIQTGDAGVTQMREGLEGGARYYLTKPFHPEILAAILHSAAKECEIHEELQTQMQAGCARLIGLMEDGGFVLKTHDEARLLAANLAQAALYPEFAVVGLTELLYNAIEHGNLDIGYEAKRQCLTANSFSAEIEARLNNPLYNQREVRVRIDKLPGEMQVVITDEGKGFDWQRYVHNNSESERYNELNSRGIAKAMIMLDDIRYAGNGNEVHCLFGIPQANAFPSPEAKRPAARGSLV